jgi:hypothetical protein
MGSGRCRTICGMNQWRGIEAPGGDEDCPCWSVVDARLAVHGLGSGSSDLEPIVNTRSSPGTDAVRIQNILQDHNTFELMNVGTVHNRQ